MKSVSTTTSVEAESRLDVVDLTDEIRRAVKDSGVNDGLVVAFCLHTTCSLFVNEWEDGLRQDLKERLEEIAPRGGYYAHDDSARRTQNLVSEGEEERRNGHSHIAQMLLGGTSQTLSVEAGQPVLGRWQRLFLVELDEPKMRQVRFTVLGI
ncbi:secondary thiamine-phosphate synthase enzyme YjbQ [soil metagenome]